MTITEQTLWGQLGTELRLQLRSVRSRRNRRELYRRWLEDALLTQRLYVAEPIDPEELEWEITDALLEYFSQKRPGIQVGVPQLVVIEDEVHHRTVEVIAIDLRGQAPNRGLDALNRAGAMMASARNAVGLAIIHGTLGQMDMLLRTIQRWVQDYGRGEILRAIPTESGIMLALDTRRLQRILEKGDNAQPLSQEIATLKELLRAAGDTKPLPSFDDEDPEPVPVSTGPPLSHRPEPAPAPPERNYRYNSGPDPGNERYPGPRQQGGPRPRYDGGPRGGNNAGNGNGNGGYRDRGDRPRGGPGGGGRYYGGGRGGGR